MISDAKILENQLYCLKKTYEEHQLIAQRYRVEYNRTQRRLEELNAPASCTIKSDQDLCNT